MGGVGTGSGNSGESPPKGGISPESHSRPALGGPCAADTSSEAWRHECEVRAVLAMPGRDARLEYLAAVTEHRGQEAAGQLAEDVRREAARRRQGRGV